MNMDMITVIALFAGLGIVLMFAIGGIVTVTMKPKMRLKKRIDAIGSLSGGGGVSAKAENRRQKRIQEKVKNVGAAGQNETMADKIRSVLLQAGLQVEVSVLVMICIIMGAVASTIFAFTAFPVWVSPAAGLTFGIGLPKFILGFMAKRRQKRFTKHFAEAIDVIVRGIRSGLPVGETLAIISREFTGPVGEEFTMIVEGQRLGMTLDEILARALKRLPTAEFKFFAIVLQIQRQTGGNLADTLENLTGVLRDRKKIQDKVQAMSSEAKSSAGIIASLPFLVLLLLSIVNPAYVKILFTEGQHLIGIGLGMMAFGIAVMAKMINFEV